MDHGPELLFPTATDVLVHILERVQPNARRRLRLVCRRWRKVIDTRTATSLRSRAQTLVVTLERLYVFDDDLSTERRSWEVPDLPGRYAASNKVVGTCNGIICMCDSSGGILLHNPATGQLLAVPCLPPQHWLRDRISKVHAYGFTHDQATGRYMVVHVPFSLGKVVVFTVGEASWQDVVIPGDTHASRCNLRDNGFVTIHGTMYWAVKGRGAKVMSFGLDGERAPSVIQLPSSRPANTWRLTEVLGRLGIAFSSFKRPTEVWVMERGVRWSHWYSVRVWRPRNQPKWHDNQHLTGPHFARGSSHVLTWKWLSTGGGCALYQHMASNDTTEAQRGTVEITSRNQGTMVAHIKTDYDTFQTFDYVETREPLEVYRRW